MPQILRLYLWNIQNKLACRQEYPLQKESYQIIGICKEVHRILGKGLLEIVYKDAIEYELKRKKIPYERKKKYEVEYKGIVDEHYAWVINYLEISKCHLGLIINFGENSLVSKRIIL